MSILLQPIWSTPVDDTETPTYEEQLTAERSVWECVRPYYRGPPEAISLSDDDTANSNGDEEGANPIMGPKRLPALDVQRHLAFVDRTLNPLPAAYVGFDSTRVWLLYWIAHTHNLLGKSIEEQDAKLRARFISTLIHCQDPRDGGFGGSPGHLGHLMCTYAAVMALAIVGGPGPCPDEDDVAMGYSVDVGKGGWDAIDRFRLYNFLLSLKQPDGSFTVHRDGEIDVRATYCVVTVSLLLGIATPELFAGVGDAVARCQTYEGGLAASAFDGALLSSGFASSSSSTAAAPSLGEAHGGYTYCAIACHMALSLLPAACPGPAAFDDSAPSPQNGAKWSQKNSLASTKLDLNAALRWAVWQQGTALEGGAMRGRTNKLVDGCYGWFSGGGLFTCLGGLLTLRGDDDEQWWLTNNASTAHGSGRAAEPSESNSKNGVGNSSGASDGWESLDEDEDDSLLVPRHPDGLLLDRSALQAYILLVAQNTKTGGLRDKPGKPSDAYHTSYNLSGLSLCQHWIRLNLQARQAWAQRFKRRSQDGEKAEDGEDRGDEWRAQCYAACLGWTFEERDTHVLGPSTSAKKDTNTDTNEVQVTHPLFNITFARAKTMLDWAYAQ